MSKSATIHYIPDWKFSGNTACGLENNEIIDRRVTEHPEDVTCKNCRRTIEQAIEREKRWDKVVIVSTALDEPLPVAPARPTVQALNPELQAIPECYRTQLAMPNLNLDILQLESIQRMEALNKVMGDLTTSIAQSLKRFTGYFGAAFESLINHPIPFKAYKHHAHDRRRRWIRHTPKRS